jgi:hypothetical protein
VQSQTSVEKLLHLLDINEFEILAPQCPTHYSSAGNGDELDIFVHPQRIRPCGLQKLIVLEIERGLWN